MERVTFVVLLQYLQHRGHRTPAQLQADARASLQDPQMGLQFTAPIKLRHRASACALCGRRLDLNTWVSFCRSFLLPILASSHSSCRASCFSGPPGDTQGQPGAPQVGQAGGGGGPRHDPGNQLALGAHLPQCPSVRQCGSVSPAPLKKKKTFHKTIVL
jgi:hypothetical protein